MQDLFTVVGASAPRVDGYDKVTGRALYTDDMNMPGQLYAGCVHSRQPHAIVVQMKTGKINRFPRHATAANASLPLDDPPCTSPQTTVLWFSALSWLPFHWQ